MTDQITGKNNLIGLKELVMGGHVHWKSDKSVRRAIADERFPHYRISGHYFFDLNEVKLWYKKREQKAS